MPTAAPLRLRPGRPCRLGAHYDGEGTHFAVFSAHASAMHLCLFSADGKSETTRIALPERTGHVWHGYAPGLGPGTLYGYRAEGMYAPEQGHRFNPNKLLIDPYARQLHGRFTQHDAQYGYVRGAAKDDLGFDERDSAPYVPRSVVSDPALFPPASRHPGSKDTGLFLYEAHAKGLTMQHPGLPGDLRGTYEGLASDAMLEHLDRLGVTAIELMPVQHFLDDDFLVERGLRNYWGYNTIAFFTPEPRYYGPAGLSGFRAMVERFHKAGIEVIMDVVYNHTAEGDQRGPTLCYRGLDNASYYRLLAGQPRYYVNDTGCGNTLNLAHPFVLRMVMDSLRFWVECMGIDGFRFDLASTLAREEHGFDHRGGFLDALRQDPVLCDVRLIAEPWDVGPGGYQLGRFTAEFREWNDRFRDTLRRYWRGDPHSAQELAGCLLGSAAQFDHDGRRAWSSVNFVAAHDGFTLADLTRYNERHNEANGENNMDGHQANFSDNCGVEGDTDDAAILARRKRRQRNLLATVFLAQGTPMLLAGDEFGHSQQGNNNAYCQDNPVGWLDWETADHNLIDYVAGLARLRRENPLLDQSRFLHGATRAIDGLPDVAWRRFDGGPLSWRDPGLSNLCLVIRASADMPADESSPQGLLLAFNRDDKPSEAQLPPAPDGWRWWRVLDTAADDAFAQVMIEDSILSVPGDGIAVAITRPQDA